MVNTEGSPPGVLNSNSMLFSVRHETLYQYSTPVGLAPHLLRLNPRPGSGNMLSRTLVIEPTPVVQFNLGDEFGNTVTRVEFAGLSEFLRIESRFELQTAAPLLPDGSTLSPLPWTAPPDDPLAVYRPARDIDPAVKAFASDMAMQADRLPLVFLEALCRTLFARVDRHIRIEGAAQTASHTLASLRGACRDITVLFLEVCRSQGIAGRFVSGYQSQADTPDGQRHLHAWPEVYLPDAGWVGWDPTHGVPVGEGHVGLCAAPNQAGTMPLEGGFYASAVTATLSYSVNIATSA